MGDFPSSWSLASHGRGRTGVETEQLLPDAVVEKLLADDDDAVEKTDDRHESLPARDDGAVELVVLTDEWGPWCVWLRAAARGAGGRDGGGNDGERKADGGGGAWPLGDGSDDGANCSS